MRLKPIEKPKGLLMRIGFWEIVEITWLNAVENYYHLINLPLEIESDGLCAIAQARPY